MFSLSTSWNSRRRTSGSDIVNEIKRLGFDTIELGFQLPEVVVRDILAIKDAGGIKVSSIHNICPIPAGVDPRCASPDFYSLSSLKELIPYAEDTGVRLALETRYYYREIPDPTEMEAVFGIIGKGRLFYWHDTGHAEVFRRLGFGSHKAFLEKNANRLIGIQLHDILNQIDDHKAPGQGDFDFRILKPYIGADVIKVIEAHGEANADDILRSVEYLTNIFETL